MGDNAQPDPLAPLESQITTLRSHATTLQETSDHLVALALALEETNTAYTSERASLLQRVEEVTAEAEAARAAAAEATAAAAAASGNGNVNISVNVGAGANGGGKGIATRHPGCEACQGSGKEKAEGGEDGGEGSSAVVKGSGDGDAAGGGGAGGDNAAWGDGWGKVDASGNGGGGANASVSVRWGGVI